MTKRLPEYEDCHDSGGWYLAFDGVELWEYRNRRDRSYSELQANKRRIQADDAEAFATMQTGRK
jgi:hypothetical protein